LPSDVARSMNAETIHGPPCFSGRSGKRIGPRKHSNDSWLRGILREKPDCRQTEQDLSLGLGHASHWNRMAKSFLQPSLNYSTVQRRETEIRQPVQKPRGNICLSAEPGAGWLSVPDQTAFRFTGDCPSAARDGLLRGAMHQTAQPTPQYHLSGLQRSPGDQRRIG